MRGRYVERFVREERERVTDIVEQILHFRVLPSSSTQKKQVSDRRRDAGCVDVWIARASQHFRTGVQHAEPRWGKVHLDPPRRSIRCR